MGTKRPHQEDTSTPHKLIKSNQKQSSDSSDCPICLEQCSDSNQCFQLECCNRSLAKDSARQTVHKTCFFSGCRHALESAVKNGERLMWMTDERFRSILRCPRCRASLPFQRRLSIEKHYLVIQYEWTDKTPIAQATHQYLGEQTISTEQALFFPTILGHVDDPTAALRSKDFNGPTAYNISNCGARVIGEPNKAPVFIPQPRRQLLGVVLPPSQTRWCGPTPPSGESIPPH